MATHLTLQEAKEKVVIDYGWKSWRHFCSDQSADSIILMIDNAAELYARSKWNEACDEMNKSLGEGFLSQSDQIIKEVDSDVKLSFVFKMLGDEFLTNPYPKPEFK